MVATTFPHHDPVKSAEPASARLAAIRSDLINAEYAVCTQKATLLTEYMRAQERGELFSRALTALDKLHARAYSASLDAQLHGKELPTWKGVVNAKLVSAWQALTGHGPLQTQALFAGGLAYVLDHMRLEVYDHELIVGNLSSERVGAPLHPDYSGVLIGAELDQIASRETNPLRITPTQKRAIRESVVPYWYRRSVLARAPGYSANPQLLNQMNEGQRFILTQLAGISHVTPDYPSVLQLGFVGLERRLKDRLHGLESATPKHAQSTAAQRAQIAFCEAGLTVCAAAIRYGRRWSEHLRGLAARETDGARRGELAELASIFERVPAQPAESFHEALQSVFITHVIVHQESFQHGVSFGRLDQYLTPYLMRDLESGQLDRARAVELIGCFLGKAAEMVPLFFERATEYFSGLSSASGITLGGRNADGSDATTLLSFLVLEAYDQLRLRQPNLHARVHPGSDSEFVSRCLEVVSKGGGMPALFNDEEVVPALERALTCGDDAHDYAVVGCAEWGIPGRSFPAAGACFVNLPHVLELALNDGTDRDGRQLGPHTGGAETIMDRARLLDAFRTQLKNTLAIVTEGNNAIEVAHGRHRPTPLLSCIVGGCIESARDVTAGGADYNSAGVQGVGLADVVDSLMAIERLVFSEGRMTLQQLVSATGREFEEDVVLHARLMNTVPKYGEDDPDVNALAAQVSAMFIEEVSHFVTPRGGRYAAGFWGMTTHQGFGRRQGWLPSGRKEGQALGNGASPYTGWDTQGPTASLSSVASVTTPPNGCVINQTLDPAFVRGEAGQAIFKGLLAGYFAKGGSQVQFNILDPEVLQAARRCPEQHRDLVVRISGYSAYFNDLTEDMKDEIISRSLHGAC